MTQLIKIDINKKDTDQESGDIYYKVETLVMQPGAAFSEEDDKGIIKNKFESALEKLHKNMR